VKVFLVYMLLRRHLWAYPTAIAVFTAFAVYQIYQFTDQNAGRAGTAPDDGLQS
jgi:uncharacterized membrane protein